MLQLPPKTYSVLNQTFLAVDFSPAEQQQCREEFEKALLVQFAETVLTKVSQRERDQIKLLVQDVQSEASKLKLQELFASLLNNEEVKALFNKVADDLFKRFIQYLYQEANDSQKQKLGTLFKPEALKS